MKTAIILTGRHDVTDQRYQPIVHAFQSSGWKNVILYEPDWQTHNVHQLVSNFIRALPNNYEPLTLLGFSLGAMIALITASNISVENLILCSPSGYFVEYDALLTKDDREWANENLMDFRDFSANKILNNIKIAHAAIIAGQTELNEWPDFRQWIGDLRLKTGWEYIELPKTGHEIEATTYKDAIRNIIHTIA